MSTEIEKRVLTAEPVPSYYEKSQFPHKLAKKKKGKDDDEILRTFKKMESNIPILTAIKQVLRYAKFLKELCTNKSKLQ